MIGFALGFVAALVVIQFYPRVGYVGAWVVDRSRRIFNQG